MNNVLLARIEEKLGERMDVDELAYASDSDKSGSERSCSHDTKSTGDEHEGDEHEDMEAEAAQADRPNLNAQALTIRQPFATGIMLTKKIYEFRGWSPVMPENGEGRWFILHAGGTMATGDEYQNVLELLRADWPHMEETEKPLSAILGWFHVNKIVTAAEWSEQYELPAKYAWCIDKVVNLTTPILQISGAQGLWRPSHKLAVDLAVEIDGVKVGKPLKLTQANLDIHAGKSESEPVWALVKEPAHDPIVVDDDQIGGGEGAGGVGGGGVGGGGVMDDDDDDEAKLFGDDPSKPMTQATLKPLQASHPTLTPPHPYATPSHPPLRHATPHAGWLGSLQVDL